jgi:DNA repair exonuclease SbcCD ATPase subunit/DNA repair exonuclease SbcCD nuclease subunit
MLVAHLSDIQIRNFKRHDEFLESFRNLYKSLQEKKPDVITLVGDIAHTKTQISPEFVQICSDFFKNLADIAKLVIIPGNHDGNLNNLTRLDALTPIVNALNHPNIYYYKRSGLYAIEGIPAGFSVFSCFDDESAWPQVRPETKYPIIGLFHGFVQGAELQNGMYINECEYKVKDFLKKVDYLMLGDIHKMQILDKDYRAAYCGSFPQQNYGESTEKGYLLWDIKSPKEHTVDFVELPNVRPYYTLYLPDSLQIPDKKLQKNARIRVMSRQLTISEKDSLKEKIRDLHFPHELKFLDELSGHRQEIKIKSIDARVENLSDLGVQEKLIKAFLKPYKLSKEALQKIFEINKRYESELRKEDEVFRNVQYRLGKMKWSNTFSFGENNEFDFSKHKGLVGIFGKNAVGKSSLAVDIPLYCVFNKTSKNIVKNDLIINDNKTECSVDLDVHVGKDVHKISRKTDVYIKSGKRSKKPVIQGRTEIDYKIHHEDGTVSDKNGLERGDTDSNIRKVFGTAEDFMATSLSPQWQLLNFINLGGTERLKLIGRYFDVDIFDKKNVLAKKEIKDIKAKISFYENIDILKKIEENTKSLNGVEMEISTNKGQQEAHEKEKKNIEDKIEEIRSKIINIQLESKADQNKLDGEIERCEQQLSEFRESLKKNKEYSKEVKELNPDVIREEMKIWEDVDKIEHKNSKLKKSYPCLKNPDCCLAKEVRSNQASIDAMKAKLTLEKASLKERYDRYKIIWKAATKGGYASVENLEAVIENVENTLVLLRKDKQRIEENKKQLEKNKELEEVLDSYRPQKDAIDRKYHQTLSEGSELVAKKYAIEKAINDLKTSQVDYEGLKHDYEAYSYYIQSMSKDGIPKIIITDNLDIINGEIKKILSHGIGFNIELKSSQAGKEVEVFFKHDKDPARKIELCSGMEKTIAAIAIRAALISVTTLPKSNVFVLDEVFASLDPEYFASLSSILEYLKQLFESVIIITHIDSFKDVVDHVIEIERDDEGFARIS